MPGWRHTLPLLAFLACACFSAAGDPPAQLGLPLFEVDTIWPNELPNNWMTGEVAGLAMDRRDHVWVVHRPGSVGTGQSRQPAPPVLAFDSAGNLVHAWGGDEDGGFAWPAREHGIFVDHQDFVWVGSEADHLVMKFTREGRRLLVIGEPGITGGSHDTRHLGGPQDLYVDRATNELYVADGWDNRRVIVFDAQTGAYLRHWGAYGEAPDDADAGPFDPDAPSPRQFRTPIHGLIVSNDGLVYVADRTSNRVQIFRRTGEFVNEVFVAPQTRGSGAAFDVALSHDPQQQFVYIADGTNNRIWIVRRQTLEVLGELGSPGRAPGEFTALHNVVVDSQGNLFTTEVRTTNRVQRFVFRGFTRPHR